jgi:hypothetical protein
VSAPQRLAYTSTVVAGGHVVAGALIGVVMMTVVSSAGGGPAAGRAALVVAVLGALAVVATGMWAGTVRLTVGAEIIGVGCGPWGRMRRIPMCRVRRAEPVILTRAQSFGLGLPRRWRTTRLTVRPGPALELELNDGEVLRLSTPDPAAAAIVIAHHMSTSGKDT